jgi:hypothetical protein
MRREKTEKKKRERTESPNFDPETDKMYQYYKSLIEGKKKDAKKTTEIKYSGPYSPNDLAEMLRSPQERVKAIIEANEKRANEHKERIKDTKKEEQEQRLELLRRKREREHVSEKIRSDLAEAHREYFEIMRLRKQDQEENYNRHKNLERLNA